jgi:hypothetical protein
MKESAQHGIVICIFLAVIFVSASAVAKGIFFISGEPTWTEHSGKPWPFHILGLDGDSLTSVWSSESQVPIYYVDTYQRDSTLVISKGLPSPKEVILFGSTKLREPRSVRTVNGDTSLAHHQLIVQATGIRLLSFQLYCSKTNGVLPEREYFNLSEMRQSSAQALSAGYEVRLSGMSSPYTGAPSNGVLPLIFENGLFHFRDSSLSLGLGPVPDAAIPIGAVRGWNLIANEIDFAAVMPLSTVSMTEREILVYNKAQQTWKLYTLPGGATYARLINGYLVGVVAQPNPESNPAEYKGFPPILSGDVVILDPIRAVQYVVHLGGDCEVLWIDQQIAFYRLGDQLYQAHIENNDFTDKRLLVSDPSVKHIHWAIPGSE